MVCFSHSWPERPAPIITLYLQACKGPPPPGQNSVGSSTPTAVWAGSGPAAAGGPTAAPAVPGKAQTAVPTATAHHQQGTSS